MYFFVNFLSFIKYLLTKKLSGSNTNILLLLNPISLNPIKESPIFPPTSMKSLFSFGLNKIFKAR